jgi:DNA-binding response OmpR family regulator
MRVLLIEDHKPLVRALRQGLEEDGFAVDVATDGQEGDFKARTAEYDVVILDIMLPKEDGLSLLQRWRKDGLSTHVLMLTARGSMEDKVKGLDLGAAPSSAAAIRSKARSSAFTIWRSTPPAAPSSVLAKPSI